MHRIEQEEGAYNQLTIIHI